MNTSTTSIYRAVHLAQAKPGNERAATDSFRQRAQDCPLGLASGELMTISLFRWRSLFLAYWESIEEPISPESLFGDMSETLLAWPGAPQPRYFAPMMDIFHCMSPEGVDHWRRKKPIERIWGRVARLKPEMVSSYIFYHYQLQEEKPGSFDKYGIITIHEDLIFFYQEQPPIVEEPLPIGKLSTHNTPPDWHGVMFPHFNLWEDAPTGQEIWREIELIAHRMIE